MKKIICVILMLLLLSATVVALADWSSDVVSRAERWVGCAEYAWGACRPGAFDCSGFVSYCLTGEYTRIGTTYTFMTWPQTSYPQPGDICTDDSHCGIYVGGGQMIHAADVGVGVICGPVQPGMIYVKYPGALSSYPVPSTGDKAHPFLWGALLMMSLGFAIVAFRIKHKEQ